MHARRLVRPVGGFAVLALALAACTSSSPEPTPTTSVAPVEIDLRTEFPDAIAEGVVTPVSTDVDAGAGTVQAIHCAVGDTVADGALLVELEPADA